MTSATGNDAPPRFVAAALIAALLLAHAPARADASAAEKAAAEALFEHGKQLLKDGRYAEACAKLQESNRIDPGIGTMLYLADCYEKNGQTASAWAQFLDAAAAAKAAGQSDREKKARDRASALEPKLNRLSISVSVAAAVVPGLEVKRDGAAVSKPLWGTPVPLDPGEHTIEASAPGKKPWTTKVTLGGEGSTAAAAIEVPALEDAPAPPKVEPPKVEPPKIDQPSTGTPSAEPPKPPPIKPGPIVTTRDTITSPARITGGVLLGVGIAGSAVGGILGMVTLLKKSNTFGAGSCRANGVCDPGARDTVNGAYSLATGADATLIAGGVSFLAGVIVLAATSPAAPERSQVIQVSPMIGAGTGGFVVGGSF